MSQNQEIKADGSFNRQKSLFSTSFGTKPGELPVEKNRYRLIWSAPCPWSHRVVIVRKILGLENVISLGAVNPIRPDLPRIDWAFSLDENNVDPKLGIQYLSEIYTKTNPDYAGRPTVPVMVDCKDNIVVNNDYFTLTNALETVWAPFHKSGAPNLYPEPLRQRIDAMNDVIYADINNGVYKCGFARSQEAYEQAYDHLFEKLAILEQLIAAQRFLLGDYITDADVRLYVTLVRFDVAYYSVFKANKNRLIDYPNLWAYARDLYRTPGFGDTTDFEAIKKHYHLSARLSADLKKENIIIPKGPDLSGWDTEHNRQHLSGKEDKFLIR
ncbi:glutathione S-transferase C-terminal domain-containing protein [Sporosarcina sp. Marseille-Q4063]|uniref:glutathione S-transferase family protein n=1 Tax=Sporosarcina sp. Marseille-Q4063 TaxID=2810514 RepID=UPI001BAF0353|nr:glutathione S-transferase C-terminal domain-containing protein [Sporosarcina sp. Marseille-Q4063]QUW23561.1 glutathione S-transferase C-terminal domain-containing protein [Sporosarcina sp. Marseille-Q4063]